MPKTDKPMVISDPLIMSGAACFRGTRVPFQTLLDHLQETSFEDFLEDFPSVTRHMAIIALEEANRPDLLRTIVAGRKAR